MRRSCVYDVSCILTSLVFASASLRLLGFQEQTRLWHIVVISGVVSCIMRGHRLYADRCGENKPWELPLLVPDHMFALLSFGLALRGTFGPFVQQRAKMAFGCMGVAYAMFLCNVPLPALSEALHTLGHGIIALSLLQYSLQYTPLALPGFPESTTTTNQWLVLNQCV